MFRLATRVVFFALALCTLPLGAQDSDALSNYFTGKEVVLKIDMPGTQQGDNVAPPTRHPEGNDSGFRPHNTNVYPERPDR